jgi:predicted RNase H-like HicB family nuclease
VSDYHVNVFYSDEDGSYIADIPDLEFCSASGSPAEEALHEVLVAKRLWFESARVGPKSESSAKDVST